MKAATSANWNIYKPVPLKVRLCCSRFSCRGRHVAQGWVYYGVFKAIADAQFLQRVLMILASDNRVLSKVSEPIATSVTVGASVM
jgi:hypothetical protein